MIKEIKGLGGTFVRAVKRILEIGHDDAGYITVNGKRFYVLPTAITANVTTTTAPAGSEARTTHATGRDKIFTSDGSKWQAFLAITPLAAGDHVAAAAALTSAALTDNSGGTANTTVQAIGASFDQAEVANNFADVAAQINALRADVGAVRTTLNAVITSLEGNGVLADS